MRILVKAAGCSMHVEHCRQNNIETLNEIIRGNATIAEILPGIALVYDPDAEKKHRIYNCKIDGMDTYGRIAFIRYEDHKIKEFHFKLDKELKTKYPGLWK